MNRRKITLLSVTITLLMVGALFSSFLLSGWAGQNREPIALPPKDAQTDRPAGNIPAPLLSFAPYDPLVLNVSTAREVVATLSRPSAYRCYIRVTWLWPTGSSSCAYRLSVRGELSAVEQYDGDVSPSVSREPDLRFLIGGGRLLGWVPRSGVFYDGALGSDTTDNLCRIPTYEDLLELPDGAITDIRYEPGENGIYLAVDTQEDLYIGRYLLSIDNGLLHQAFFYDINNEDELVYHMEITDYQPGDPGDEYFRQPDGTVGI